MVPVNYPFSLSNRNSSFSEVTSAIWRSCWTKQVENYLFFSLYPLLLKKKLEYNCFTILCSFLQYNEVDQRYVYICCLPLGLPSKKTTFRMGENICKWSNGQRILQNIQTTELTCLLWNLYAGQEATVRTGHGTTNWFPKEPEYVVQEKEYIKAVYCHLAYLTYTQSTSRETLGWRKYKLESRLPGEISITSDMQMTPPLWQKVKKN